MMAVDTSALMAVILNEKSAADCSALLERETGLLISAATMAEALIVSDSRGVLTEMARLLDGLGFEVVAVTGITARRIAEIYSRWGKGRDRAGLNFGDCFAYDVAKMNACPLLFVGDDFSRTDIRPAL